MLVSTLITNVRMRVQDTEKESFTDEELLTYVNDAINNVGYILINLDNNQMLKQVTLTETSTTLPVDFYKLCGRKPIEIINGKFEVYGKLPMTVRYFKKPPLVTASTDSLPYDDNFNQLIQQIVVALALNRNEYNISQDIALVEDVKKLLGMAEGAK